MEDKYYRVEYWVYDELVHQEYTRSYEEAIIMANEWKHSAYDNNMEINDMWACIVHLDANNGDETGEKTYSTEV